MRVSLTRSLLALAAAALLLPLGAWAQTSSAGSEHSKSSTQNSSSSSLNAADQRFVKRAAEGGMAEVELGQLAEQRAQSPQVKQFAKRMVNDHGKGNEKVKSLASEKGVQLPTKLDAKDEAAKNRLSKLSGERFDKAYMRDMVRDHTHDVNEFKHEASTAKDPDLKNLASQMLPTLESHLSEARQIAPSHEVNAPKKGGD